MTEVDEIPAHLLRHLVTMPVARLDQLHPGRGGGDGPVGDCYRTCLACLLDAPTPTFVPHFADITEALGGQFMGWHTHRLARQWIRSEFGLDLATLDFAEAVATDLPYLATIESKTGPWLHCVVARGTKIIHDPSGFRYPDDPYPDDALLIGLSTEMLAQPFDPEPDAEVRQWAASLNAVGEGDREGA